MIWPQRKRKKPTPEQVDALRAKVHAELQLRNAEQQQGRAEEQQSLVAVLARRVREINHENHFGPSIAKVFKEQP